MTLEQLRMFVAVAEREHVTQGAAALNVTQSAASAAVAAIEAGAGVALFHRVGRRIELTEGGRAFLVQARAVLAQAAGAERLLADFAGLSRGTLRLVASQTIASYWLPPRLAAFHRRYPQLDLDVAIDNSAGAAARVLAGAAELGFVEGTIDQPALATWPIAQDRLVLVASTPQPVVDADWLRTARWIVRERGSGTRSSVAEALTAHGIDTDALDVAMALPSNEAVATAVEAGAGIAVLSDLVVRRAVAAGHLHALPFALPTRPFFALRHKERYRTRAADALLTLLGEGEG